MNTDILAYLLLDEDDKPDIADEDWMDGVFVAVRVGEYKYGSLDHHMTLNMARRWATEVLREKHEEPRVVGVELGQDVPNTWG